VKRLILLVLAGGFILIWSATEVCAEKITQGQYAAALANRLSACADGVRPAAGGTDGAEHPLSPIPAEAVQACMASLEDQSGDPPPWPSACRALEECIADLVALGIEPPGGWQPKKTLTDDDISDLAEDVILAAKEGKLDCEPQHSVQVLAATAVSGGYSSQNVYATAYRQLDYYFPPVLERHITSGGGIPQEEDDTVSTNQ
jgi:hypothetical protein